MKKYLITSIVALGIVIGVLTPVLASNADAVNVFNSCGGANGSTSVCAATKSDDAKSLIGRVINVILWALGIAAVLVIIIAGFMYITSSGDPGKAKTAREAILYAVIGLVVAVGAYAIVQFVMSNV